MCSSVPCHLCGSVELSFVPRSNYPPVPLLSPDALAGVLLVGVPGIVLLRVPAHAEGWTCWYHGAHFSTSFLVS